MNLKPIKNPAVRWGELEDTDKIARIAAFMNQLTIDSEDGPIKGASRYMKTYDVHPYSIRAMVSLKLLSIADKIHYKCNYGHNEIKLMTRAKKVFEEAKAITNTYGQANAAKKKAAKLAQKKMNSIEASKPVWSQDIAKEAKVKEIAEKVVKNIIPEVLPEMVKNIKVKVDVEFNIKWNWL